MTYEFPDLPTEEPSIRTILISNLRCMTCTLVILTLFALILA